MSGYVEPARAGAAVEFSRREATSAEAEGGPRPTLDTIPALVAVFLPDGTLDFVNQAFSAYTGLTPAGKALTWTAVVHPDDGPSLLNAWQISREDQDQFSYASHQKAINAIKNGYFKDGILPLPVGHNLPTPASRRRWITALSQCHPPGSRQ